MEIFKNPAMYQPFGFKLNEYFLMTRHPITIKPTMKVLGSLSTGVWMMFLGNYLGIALISFVALFLFKNYISNIHVYEQKFLFSISSPDFCQYPKLLRFALLSQILLVCIGTSMQYFYNTDLRSVLVTENFEKTIDGLNDVTYLQTYFYSLYDDYSDCKYT